MTRNNIPLPEYELEDGIEINISFNNEFLELKALNNWGATLEQLDQWKHGKLDPSLVQLAKSYYLADRMYQTHRADAINIEQVNRSKSKVK